MARDILSIPASGVGVERIFNGARDVCQFRRSRLQPDIIKALMIIYHYNKTLISNANQSEILHDTLTTDDCLLEAIQAEENERFNEIDKSIDVDYISDEDEEVCRPLYNKLRSLRQHSIFSPNRFHQRLNRTSPLIRQQWNEIMTRFDNEDLTIYDPPSSPTNQRRKKRRLPEYQ